MLALVPTWRARSAMLYRRSHSRRAFEWLYLCVYWSKRLRLAEAAAAAFHSRRTQRRCWRRWRQVLATTRAARTQAAAKQPRLLSRAMDAWLAACSTRRWVALLC